MIHDTLQATSAFADALINEALWSCLQLEHDRVLLYVMDQNLVHIEHVFHWLYCKSSFVTTCVLKYFWSTARLSLYIRPITTVYDYQPVSVVFIDVAPSSVLRFDWDKIGTTSLLLYVIYTCQKSLNYIDAFNYKQKWTVAPFNSAHHLYKPWGVGPSYCPGSDCPWDKRRGCCPRSLCREAEGGLPRG